MGDTEDHPQVHLSIIHLHPQMEMYFCLFVGRHLAQHKLVFKSKMKRDVDGDMIRFQVHT